LSFANSLQAMTRGGILYIRTEFHAIRFYHPPGQSGGGIPSEVLQRIFEPFSHQDGRLSGLGLMIVERIVRRASWVELR